MWPTTFSTSFMGRAFGCHAGQRKMLLTLGFLLGTLGSHINNFGVRAR